MKEALKTKKPGSLMHREWRWAYLFIAPICLQFIIFTVLPVLAALRNSLTDYNQISDARNFVFLENFKTLLSDIRFRKAVGNTVFLMLGMPVSMVLSFMLALALNRKLKGRVVFRVILYLPAVSSALAIGIVWKWMFNAEFGVINRLFGLNVHWLTNPKMIKPSLIIKGVWGGLGGTMLLFLAALQNIGSDYYEVADIEGANAWQKITKITLPLITPVIFYMVVTGIINGMNAFSDNYIIVSGDSASTIVFYLWDKIKIGQAGLVSAGAVMVGATVFVITLVQFKISNRWVYSA
jgi:multiple sugar transport system permease protein